MKHRLFVTCGRMAGITVLVLSLVFLMDTLSAGAAQLPGTPSVSPMLAGIMTDITAANINGSSPRLLVTSTVVPTPAFAFAPEGLSSTPDPSTRLALLNHHTYLPLVLKSKPVTPTATPTRTATPAATITSTRVPDEIWRPALNSAWQWQLNTPVDLSVDVPVYDIDGFNNDASVVAALHAQGRKVICYLDIGGWESYRPDAGNYPPSVLGAAVDGWPQERWIDIRQIDILAPILGARLDMCKAKGFDAVEPDMIEAYNNNSGFPLTAQDQITFNKWIAAQVHARGMSVVLKGDVEQVAALEPYFDFALNEECFSYDECGVYNTTFIAKGKAVFQVEYNLATNTFCPEANALNFSSMKKHLSLDAYRAACQ